MTGFDLLTKEFPALRVMKNEPLANHTSFRIGGCANMIFPETPDELAAVYRWCIGHDCRPMVLGAGSNVLAPDAGLETPVICTKSMNAVEPLWDGQILAQCGASLAKLACFARDLGLTGLEFAHGIPGSVGGGVYMNAGAYGGELCQVAVHTTALLPDGTVWEAEGEAQGFSYRNSAFQKLGALVLQTRFQLHPGDREEIAAKMAEFSEKRRSSQPLDKPSAGSTFKRPATGYAAALIDAAGLKGTGVGQAAVSEKHAGFVVNLGGATAADVVATMELVQKRVLEHSGVLLEPEVRIW